MGRHVPYLRSAHVLSKLEWDVCFLQEVSGHLMERLADTYGWGYSYGFTRTVGGRHYGNGIFIKSGVLTPLLNHDISASKIEARRMLLSRWETSCFNGFLVCTHFGLLRSWRLRQVSAVLKEISKVADDSVPVIMGGDFNEYSQVIVKRFSKNGFESLIVPKKAPSFPALLPTLTLDYIYGRGVTGGALQTHSDFTWAQYSDHCPVFASILKVQ